MAKLGGSLVELTPKQERLMALASGPARFVLAYGGSRSGKTFAFCCFVAVRAVAAPGSRHMIYRKTLAAAKAALAGPQGTLTQALKLRFPGTPWTYNKQEGSFLLDNGSEIALAGIDEHNIEKILGNEYVTIYGNELSETPYASFEVIRSRLAQTPTTLAGEIMAQKYYGDLNPTVRSHWTYRVWQDHVDPRTMAPLSPELYAHLQINPEDNRANLSPAYLDDLRALGERARRRFYEGEYSADVDEALWRRAMIQRTQRDVRELSRIVVAVDPSVSNEPGSDETGIVACGIDEAKLGYVLADDSGKLRAEDWARRAVALHNQLGADAIVAEVNNGGDLVENQILAMVRKGETPPRVIKVHASRGKYIRAEPIAGLYERRRVYHVGEFPELEDQMCSFTSDFDRKAQGVSPDRLDAAVWGFTALFGDMVRSTPKGKTPPPAPAVPDGWLGG